jgi:hypothetical protein
MNCGCGNNSFFWIILIIAFVLLFGGNGVNTLDCGNHNGCGNGCGGYGNGCGC